MNTAITSDLSQTETTATGSPCDEAVLVALAGDSAIGDQGQERLASIGSPAVRKALAGNPCLNERQQQYLVSTGSIEVKCQLAKNPSLVDSLQRRFAEGCDSEIREALAENTKLNPAYQTLLLEDKEGLRHPISYTLQSLASNPALTADLQQSFAASDDLEVVASLAKNPSLPKSMIEQLSNREEVEILAGLACNTSIKEPLQAQLISSSHSEVQESIARNPSLKTAQQALLAHEGSIDVRLALLENRGLDAQVKAYVSSSFSVNDLNWAEQELNNAESKSSRLQDQHNEALEKCIKACGGFFASSDEKIDRLNSDENRIQRRLFEADNEAGRLSRRVFRLRELTQNQLAAKSDGGNLSAESAAGLSRVMQ